GGVEFAQTFDKLSLFRRPLQTGQKNLVWDGGSAVVSGVSNTHWEIVALSAEGNKLAPTVWHGEPFMDRLIWYNAKFAGVVGRDTWYISDIEDYTSYDDVYQVVRTNTGESDYITRIMSYFRGSVLIFKNQSIHMATVQ